MVKEPETIGAVEVNVASAAITTVDVPQVKCPDVPNVIMKPDPLPLRVSVELRARNVLVPAIVTDEAVMLQLRVPAPQPAVVMSAIPEPAIVNPETLNGDNVPAVAVVPVTVVSAPKEIVGVPE